MKTLGLLIDCGRKYWPLSTLKMAVLTCERRGFTRLILHFSDNEGLRLESKRYPGLASNDHLTQDELADLLSFAKAHRVLVIPEFDTPGHLKHILDQVPEFALPGAPGALDISNPKAVAFIHNLLDEYLQLFPDSPYVHLGADEFLPFGRIADYPKLVQASKKLYGSEAHGLEVYVDYVNDLVKRVKQAGKTARVWNDGFYRSDVPTVNQLTRDVEICYWTRWDANMASLETYEDLGYTILNFNDNCFYFVLGEAAGYSYPTYETVKAKWLPNRFAQGQTSDRPYSEAIFSVWGDQADALNHQEILDMIAGPMTAMQEINQTHT